LERRDLEQFGEALANPSERAGTDGRSKLAQLELDAVRARTDDLRAKLEVFGPSA